MGGEWRDVFNRRSKVQPPAPCCVCGEPGVSTNIAGHGFCAVHLASWQKFAAQPRSPFVPVRSVFQTWLAAERAQLEEE